MKDYIEINILGIKLIIKCEPSLEDLHCKDNVITINSELPEISKIILLANAILDAVKRILHKAGEFNTDAFVDLASFCVCSAFIKEGLLDQISEEDYDKFKAELLNGRKDQLISFIA